MKQFCCTLLFFLATLTSYAQNFADFFKIKHYEWITFFHRRRQPSGDLSGRTLTTAFLGRTTTPFIRTSLGGKRANYRERRCHRTMYL